MGVSSMFAKMHNSFLLLCMQC